MFLTHAVLSYQWYHTGKWGGNDSGICGLTGHLGVALFFQITGFLFWGKVLSADRMNWRALYVSRVRRLVPLYLFSVTLVMLVVAVETGFELKVGLRALAKEMGTWLTFSIIEPRDVNGLRFTERINAGVLWTLAYEWKYYAALPVLAFFVRPWSFGLLGVITISFVLINPTKFIVVHFLFGMIAAYLVRFQRWHQTLTRPVFSLFGVLLILTLLLFGRFMPKMLSACLLFIFFVLVAHGNSLFGLLHFAASKFLGTISYSIYLLHGIFLYVSLALVDRITPVVHLSPVEYWLLIGGVVFSLVLGCGLTYQFVEHPFIRKVAR